MKECHITTRPDFSAFQKLHLSFFVTFYPDILTTNRIMTWYSNPYKGSVNQTVATTMSILGSFLTHPWKNVTSQQDLTFLPSQNSICHCLSFSILSFWQSIELWLDIQIHRKVLWIRQQLRQRPYSRPFLLIHEKTSHHNKTWLFCLPKTPFVIVRHFLSRHFCRQIEIWYHCYVLESISTEWSLMPTSKALKTFSI